MAGLKLIQFVEHIDDGEEYLFTGRILLILSTLANTAKVKIISKFLS